MSVRLCVKMYISYNILLYQMLFVLLSATGWQSAALAVLTMIANNPFQPNEPSTALSTRGKGISVASQAATE